MKEFIKKYREILLYLLFGVLTTAVSMGIYFLVLFFGKTVIRIDSESNEFYFVRVVAQILQWVGGVLVAFFTSKYFVFNVKSEKKNQTLIELLKFSIGRLATFGLDTALTFGTVFALTAINYQPFTFILTFTVDLWSKIIASIVVVITNYIISKLIVFKKKKEQ